jgi:mono/diheme cytochrome c family protein
MAVAADPEANAMGERMFLTYCVQCHGADARRAAKSFPNLTDSDWLWGGDAGEHQGDHHQRPQRRDAAVRSRARRRRRRGRRQLRASLNGSAHDSVRAQRGKEVRGQLRGLPRRRRQGQPDARRAQPDRQPLAVRRSEAVIIETINKGRNNQMPAFGCLPRRGKVHLLAAYVLSLRTRSKRPAVATAASIASPGGGALPGFSITTRTRIHPYQGHEQRIPRARRRRRKPDPTPSPPRTTLYAAARSSTSARSPGCSPTGAGRWCGSPRSCSTVCPG